MGDSMLRVSSFFVLLCLASSACVPETKCVGQRYYDPDNRSCRPCPKDAAFKDGTCACKSQYEFAHNKCVLRESATLDGAVLDASDDSTTDASLGMADCSDYCDFAKVCIGDNPLAQAAISDVIASLHADDAVACVSNCSAKTTAIGNTDPVVACIQNRRESAACAGGSTQASLLSAITLLGDCCKPHSGNALCASICDALTANPLVKNQIDFCD
jgi:hypothetical protein